MFACMGAEISAAHQKQLIARHINPVGRLLMKQQQLVILTGDVYRNKIAVLCAD